MKRNLLPPLCTTTGHPLVGPDSRPARSDPKAVQGSVGTSGEMASFLLTSQTTTHSTACKAIKQATKERGETSRRQALQLATALATGSLLPSGAAQAKGPGAFTAVKDAQDGYSFVYPFGWQEVAVRGQDIVFKDVIEPLESVSVSLTKTDKKDMTEFGGPAEVAFTLADKVLTSPQQEVKVLDVKQKEVNGRIYYEFEFAAKAVNYLRHAFAVVTVANGKFYTLTIGANEKRWNKVKKQLQTVIDSFEVQERF
ncbi:hypothetical protein WJX72_000690 [[Myrmecia] bisecta]|uniref:PsbP C-terminal domain-containing protein n=1 Tax=[Myrmecia] bisecta TaxID=41462 RepID=A0AAW1Q387_9CHLO